MKLFLAIIALSTAGCLCNDSLNADRCLDRGGRWNDEKKICEMVESGDVEPINTPLVPPTQVPVSEFLIFEDQDKIDAACNLDQDAQAAIDACAALFRANRDTEATASLLGDKKKAELTTSFLDYLKTDQLSWFDLFLFESDAKRHLLLNVVSKDVAFWFDDNIFETDLSGISTRSWTGSEDLVKNHLQNGVSEFTRLTVTATHVERSDNRNIYVLELDSHQRWHGRIDDQTNAWFFSSTLGHRGDAPCYAVVFSENADSPDRIVRVKTKGNLHNSTICCLLKHKIKQDCACFQKRGSGYAPPVLSEKSGSVISTLRLIDKARADSVMVALDVTNHTPDPVEFCKYQTPFEESLTSDLVFEVVDSNGKTVSYRGVLAKRPAPSHQKGDFVTLGAGESITGAMNIASSYRFQASTYQIRFRGTPMNKLPDSKYLHVTFE